MVNTHSPSRTTSALPLASPRSHPRTCAPAHLRTLVVLVALVIGLASAAAAQFGGRFGFGPRGFPPRFPTKETFGLGFNFCRGIYRSARREAGGQGWSTDYPDAELNFSIRLAELTRTRVKLSPEGKPDHVTVRLTDEELFQCPYLHMEDTGTMTLNEEEIAALRAYLLKGGFIWVDDFWGSYAWDEWVQQITRVLPPPEYTIQDLPLDHPIFRSQFEIKEFPQIPSIQMWRGNSYSTSERGADSAVPEAKAISDRHGNVMVMMTHNTDISDAWEREGEDPRYFYSFSPRGYAVGINVILYAMTH
jgi:hypothetical protein